MAADADLSKQLVGSWEFSATNTTMNGATQTMSTQTHYSVGGVFTMDGTIGVAYPTNEHTKVFIKRNDGSLVPREQAISRPIGGSGVWRIEQGYLYTTLTNSSSMATNVESKDEVLSLTAESFTYRTQRNQTRTANRKQ